MPWHSDTMASQTLLYTNRLNSDETGYIINRQIANNMINSIYVLPCQLPEGAPDVQNYDKFDTFLE